MEVTSGTTVTSGATTVDRKQPYKAPAIAVLGSLHQLTLDGKVGHLCDVTCFHHGSG